jgi:type II secretory pathway component PulJ
MKRTRRTGISLYEVVVSLGIFVIAMNMAAQLFRSLITTGAESGRTLNQVARIDSAVAKLRGDVWSAGKIDILDSHTVRLSRGDNLTATWAVSDNSLTRTDASGHVESFSDTGKGWSFARDGAALTISDDSAHDATAMRLVSQVLLAGAMR